MTDNEYYKARRLTGGEAFCPLMRDACLEGNCALWDCEYDYCGILSIAQELSNIQSELEGIRKGETK